MMRRQDESTGWPPAADGMSSASREDSVHDEPTKVGPVSDESWAKLIADAQPARPRGVEVETGEHARARAGGFLQATSERGSRPMVDESIPRLYDDDDKDAATLLHPDSRETKLIVSCPPEALVPIPGVWLEPGATGPLHPTYVPVAVAVALLAGLGILVVGALVFYGRI